MKKSRIVGFALTLASTLVVGSAMGQVPTPLDATKNFVEIKAGTDDLVSLVQKGINHGFYVIPDAAYHASYSTDGKMTTGFKWDWNVAFKPAAATVTPATATGTADGTATTLANFQVFSFSDPGRYSITVAESAPAAFGGCSGNLQLFKVYAFDAPSMENVTTDPANADCISTADILKNVHFNLFSSGTPYVKYKITQEDGTISAGGPTWGAPSDLVASTEYKPATIWNWNQAATTLTALTANGIQVGLTTPLDTATAKLGKYDLEIAQKLPAPSGTVRVKRYTFILEGVNGLLSRKAEINQTTGAVPANYTYYTNITATKTNKVTFIVAVAPKTGPVYHIGNNKAN